MKLSRVLTLTLLLGAAVLSSGLFSGAASGGNTTPGGTLTFNKDIAPIFYNNCVSCHRPGEIAPMSLQTYKEIRPWAKSIREKVVSREMPPWHADPAFGHWSNDRRMAQTDIDKIVAWVNAGAREGDAKDLPPMPKFASGWQIGDPDQVFHMPEDFTVPATGTVPYKNFVAPTNFTEDKYVTALEARAGNLSVVHHIVIYVRDPKNPQPKRRGDLGDGLLGALSPGQTPFKAQPGMAKLIPAGAQLIFQMHYTPNGTAAKDRSYVGLRFAKAPVDKVITTTAAWQPRFEIPPGAENHEVRAEWIADMDMDIVSFSPHMHLRGRDYLYKLHRADGTSETILSVPKYDFSWQVYYYPKQGIRVRKGERIETIAHFDNSTRNKVNPDPTIPVRFGEQTWDEMMNGFFDFIPAGSAKAPVSGSGND
ncbi:MAG: thiol-disulfide isomerase [Blastocatellia bacterium]